MGRESKPESFRIEALEPSLDVQLDHVGSLENAAKVIGALHRGKERFGVRRLQAAGGDARRGTARSRRPSNVGGAAYRRSGRLVRTTTQ